MARERREDVHLVHWKHSMVVTFSRFDPAGGFKSRLRQSKGLVQGLQDIVTHFWATFDILIINEVSGFGFFLDLGNLFLFSLQILMNHSIGIMCQEDIMAVFGWA